MQYEKFQQAMYALGVNYGREITEPVLKLYWSQFKDLNDEDFQAAVNNHVQDTEDGKFWPTVAHLNLAIYGCQNDAMVAAAMAFDKNPQIDGAISFDVNNENYHMRELRKKRYIQMAARNWKHSTNAEKLHFAKTGELPTPPDNLFKIEKRDYSRILEGKDPREVIN